MSLVMKLLNDIRRNRNFQRIQQAMHDHHLLLHETNFDELKDPSAVRLLIRYQFDIERIRKNFPADTVLIDKETGMISFQNKVFNDSIYQYSTIMPIQDLITHPIYSGDIETAMWDFIFRAVSSLLDMSGIKHSFIIARKNVDALPLGRLDEFLDKKKLLTVIEGGKK